MEEVHQKAVKSSNITQLNCLLKDLVKTLLDVQTGPKIAPIEYIALKKVQESIPADDLESFDNDKLGTFISQIEGKSMALAEAYTKAGIERK